MKKLSVFFALAVACLLAGCLERPKESKAADSGVIYRHHFIGSPAIGQGTNATKLKEILDRDSTKAMGAEVVKKLARAPRELWKKQLPGNAKDGAELIEPLLTDLFLNESYVEARGSTARPECVIAAQVSDERAKAWDKNLKDLASAWQLGQPADVTVQGFKGWEITRQDYPNKLQFVRAGKWVLAGFGSERLGGDASPYLEALRAAAKTGGPAKALGTNVLLEVQADLPRLTPGIPALAGLRLPPTELSVFGRGEYIRTEAQFRYAQSLNWKFEPWKIPTNSIPASIISFTAAQGVTSVLKNIDGVKDLGLKTLPNQFCAWGVGDAQGQVYAAIPVEDATNTIQVLAPTLPKFAFNRLTNAMGNFAWASNRAEIMWQGLPWIVPYLRPLKHAGNDYLFFGMLPAIRTSNTPPAELFAQLGDRKDLAYYDWEITGERGTHARQMYQLGHIINKRRVPDPKFPSEHWMRDIQDLVGPTITEITVKSPTELNLVRKSHIGFTGFELATFSLWLQSPRFPLEFEFRPPVPKVLPTNALPAGSSAGTPRPTNAPAAAPSEK